MVSAPGELHGSTLGGIGTCEAATEVRLVVLAPAKLLRKCAWWYWHLRSCYGSALGGVGFFDGLLSSTAFLCGRSRHFTPLWCDNPNRHDRQRPAAFEDLQPSKTCNVYGECVLDENSYVGALHLSAIK